MAIKGTQRNVT